MTQNVNIGLFSLVLGCPHFLLFFMVGFWDPFRSNHHVGVTMEIVFVAYTDAGIKFNTLIVWLVKDDVPVN